MDLETCRLECFLRFGLEASCTRMRQTNQVVCHRLKKLDLLKRLKRPVDTHPSNRNVRPRKRNTEKLLSRFAELLKLLLNDLLFNHLPFKFEDFRVIIKHVHGAEETVLDSRMDAEAANKRKVLLPVNVDGTTVALHFYKRGTICGEKVVDVFETQLIVPGGDQDMYEIPFAQCDAILQISLGGELSAVGAAEFWQREADNALAAASGGMKKVARCTEYLRPLINLAMAASEVNPFAKAGFAVAKLAFDTLDEVSGTHDAFKKLSDECEEYIEVFKEGRKVFNSRQVQAGLGKALTAIIGALERIPRHYEQTLIKWYTRSSVKEEAEKLLSALDRRLLRLLFMCVTEGRADQIADRQVQ
ncbi:hypothetical protein B0H14DRAFT_2955097 [Mycena olivaceomarginata]|nr:hypothetical protein B0H14DRAFT_2955097 [Mycena olivaceomarginata]